VIRTAEKCFIGWNCSKILIAVSVKYAMEDFSLHFINMAQAHTFKCIRWKDVRSLIPSSDIFFCIRHCNQRGCEGRNPRGCSPKGKVAWTIVSCYVRQYGLFWLLKHVWNNDAPGFLQQEYSQNFLLPLLLLHKNCVTGSLFTFSPNSFLLSVSLFFRN